MKQHLTLVAFFLLLFAVALVFRLPNLGNRPMHADEAVQAARFRELWLEGRYVYDPNEYHGPTLNYATLPIIWVENPPDFAQVTAAMLRLVPALFGAGLVWLFYLLHDGVGKPAALIAGLLTAISPAAVFYSRYYIHETLFVFFTLAVLATAWRYLRTGRLTWCLAAGASLGLMQATKETSVLAYAAAVGALLAVVVWNRVSPAHSESPFPRWARWHFALGCAATIVVAVTLYSSFFTNWHGPLDGLLTYVHWVRRAGGHSPQTQPWYYFLRILAFWRADDGTWWSEGLTLALAATSLIAMVWRAGRHLPVGTNLNFARWVSCYTLLSIAAYSVIPYKTPWCLLSFHVGLVLLAGMGAVTLIQLAPHFLLKATVVVVLLAACGQLAWQSYQTSFVHFADPENPFVHSPTQAKITELVDMIEELTQVAPEGRDVEIRVIWHDNYYWPLPWYLRGFQRVGYWNHVPDKAAAPIIISSPQVDEQLYAQLERTHYAPYYYGVRHNVLVQLWVRDDLWEAHLRRIGRL